MKYNNDGAGLVGCLALLLWVAMVFVGPLMVYLGWEAIANAYWNWQDRRYERLLTKFDKIQQKLEAMRRARG